MAVGLSGCATPLRHPPSLTMPAGVYHTVAAGQTLYRIAKAYNVDLNELMRVNGITDPTALEIGQRIFIPGATRILPVIPYRAPDLTQIERLVGPRCYSSYWRSITIHHSATEEGNADCFDREHRRRKMGGLFYHFVIGNGSRSGDGEIEVGWRWRRQRQVNRPWDIQICLVGNFNNEHPTPHQIETLVQLIKVLSKQYNISPANVRLHKDVATKPTDCPGRYFPWQEIKEKLARQ